MIVRAGRTVQSSVECSKPERVMPSLACCDFCTTVAKIENLEGTDSPHESRRNETPATPGLPADRRRTKINSFVLPLGKTVLTQDPAEGPRA
jgi:hypothetical protein